MKIKSAVAVCSLLAFASAVFASSIPTPEEAQEFARTNPAYYELDPASVKVELISQKTLDNYQLPVFPKQEVSVPPSGSGDPIFDTIDSIINLGERIFGIIAKNKPVVNVAVNYAMAIPKGATHWTDFEGWQKPKSYVYGWSAANRFNQLVVDFKYQVLFTYGGSYNSKGQYLTGVSVQPLDLMVAWGYTVNAGCEVPDSTIANVGTKDNPIAAMTMIFKTSIDTIVQHDEFRDVFYIQGNGEFKKIK